MALILKTTKTMIKGNIDNDNDDDDDDDDDGGGDDDDNDDILYLHKLNETLTF